jgi:acetolactate synthase-1/2/3 large subunit
VALDGVAGIRGVLGLFEGVCTGAADGYGRMTGKPALTLLHLGPGFANGIANLHNARRAHAPVVNLIGDQATWHLAADAPLTSDILSLARPVSHWVQTSRGAGTLAAETAEAIAAARQPPGQVATLIIPSDCQWEEADGAAPTPAPRRAPTTDAATVSGAAAALREGKRAMLLLGSSACSERGLRAAQRVATITGCAVLVETFTARIERGGGIPSFDRFPYFPEQGMAALKDVSRLVLAGALSPVAFFGYPNLPSRLVPDGCDETTLASPSEDVVDALEALAEALGARQKPPALPHATRPGLPDGALDPNSLGQAIVALQPEDAIVVEEGATSGLPYAGLAASAPRHTALGLTGGAIGQGLPCATGAAIACPSRRVIALQADGSGMYTLQSLWTQAREGLDVTTVICANRRYRILQVELLRAGVAEPGPQAVAMTDLSNPVLDWVSLARGMGVPAARATTANEFATALQRALAEPGPQLIEAIL